MTNHLDSRIILFADLCDSTRLYERLGDDRARECLADALKRWEAIVARHDGTVVKRIGDELMCLFSDPREVVAAAIDMQLILAEASECVGIDMHGRIGFYQGSILHEGDDVFGDTVNLAARMVQMARPRQILTNGTTLLALPDAYRAFAQRRGRFAVKGKSEEFDLYEIVWEAEELTHRSASSDAKVRRSMGLRLWLADREIELTLGSAVVRIGRQGHNDVMVEGELISRSHARIERRRNRFVLIDESTNGTWVRGEDGTPQLLARDEITLEGAGWIGLGEPPLPDAELAVRFEVSPRGCGSP